MAGRMRAVMFPLLAAAGFIAGPAGPAGAHPHVWIDMTVSSVFNEDGPLTGFRHVWTFDEFYTVFQLEALGGQQPTDAVLAEFATDMIESIASLGYLMKVETKDGIAGIAGARDEALVLRGDSRLELAFTADLEGSVDARAWPVRYAVFDPEYYIEMLHVKGTGTLMTGTPPATCTTDLQRPQPTFEMLSLAAAVEVMQDDPPALGETFAEKVTIDCRPEADRSES